MPRKKLRNQATKGRRKHRQGLWDQHLERRAGKLTVGQASSSESYLAHKQAHRNIMQGKHPTTGEPLPINEDGAEFLP